jgi:hypothetical protein
VTKIPQDRHIAFTANPEAEVAGADLAHGFRDFGYEVSWLDRVEGDENARNINIRSAVALVALTGFRGTEPALPSDKVAADIQAAVAADVAVVFPHGYPRGLVSGDALTPSEWQALGAKGLDAEWREELIDVQVGGVVTAIEELLGHSNES